MYQFADYSEVVSPDPIYYIVSANPKQAEVILLKYGMPVPTVDMESPEMALYNSAVRLIEAHPETEDEFYEIHPDKQRMGKSCYSCGEKHMKVSNYCSSGCQTNHSDYNMKELIPFLNKLTVEERMIIRSLDFRSIWYHAHQYDPNETATRNAHKNNYNNCKKIFERNFILQIIIIINSCNNYYYEPINHPTPISSIVT